MKKKDCQVKYEKLPQDDPITKQVIRNIINRDKNHARRIKLKTLSTEQQIELQALLEEATFGDFPAETRAKLRYWVIELKPKRIRKKNILNVLDTEEGVIEQAYRDHTGGI